MVAKASIIEIYARADAAGRVDIICKNYSNFIGIVIVLERILLRCGILRVICLQACLMLEAL